MRLYTLHYSSVAALLGVLLQTGCQSKPDAPKEVETYTVRGDTISIPTGSPLSGRIRTITLQTEEYRLNITTAAQVEANLTKLAKITPPFAGRITDIYVKLGQRVRQGQPLFSMNPPEYAEAQKALLDARSEVNLAQTELSRQADLVEHGVGIARNLDQAKRDYAIRQDEYRKATTILKYYGVDPNQGFGKPLVVRSPLSGNVALLELVKGEYKNDPSQTAVQVYDPSSLWITANLKEKDLRYIHEGDSSSATVIAYPEKVFNGRVFHVDEMVNPDTRTIKVLMEFNNRGALLKPGMFATIIFTDTPQQAILIPAKAITLENDRQRVYVQTTKGTFVKRVIETGGTQGDRVHGDRVHVTKGLKAGEVIAGEGSFYLINAR